MAINITYLSHTEFVNTQSKTFLVWQFTTFQGHHYDNDGNMQNNEVDFFQKFFLDLMFSRSSV